MTDAHTSRAHATLSPSSASRWMACPASVRLSEGIPNTSSIFAAEGTACHELAALCLQQEMDPTTFIDEWVDIETGKIIETVLAEEGRPPESIFDFVQGITALARDRSHQDARLDMEGKAKKLLDRAA